MIDHFLKPASLPDETQHVSVVQTHISTVFVADEYVYKIKKPVDFGFLDFSSLSKRRHYCHQEVKLNQRLAPDVYLGVLSILRDNGGYRMEADEGQANVVEYAVKMRRIPDDVLMKSVFDKGVLRDDHLQEIAAVLGRFHQEAARSAKIDEFGEARAFRINTDENFEQTKKYIGITIDKADFDSLSEWTATFYRTNEDLFRARIAAQKIRDCHGDLHMEHVCLVKPVAIIDCIEFNERFRYTDTIADIAFLLMDLEYRDGGAFAERLWDYYQALMSETGMDALLTFYKIYRAYVRGKVISFQLDDERIGMEAKQGATLAAKKYFKLARSYIERSSYETS
jgi:aminoglycoside phosphotransferase family enzyme